MRSRSRIRTRTRSRDEGKIQDGGEGASEARLRADPGRDQSEDQGPRAIWASDLKWRVV
jgi:hypothetical protein